MVSQRKDESREAYLKRKREVERRYYQEHKKEMNARSRKNNVRYHQEHKKEDNVRSLTYYHEHRKDMNIRSLAYYYEHKEEIKIYNREYQQEHNEEIKIYNREYQQEHPEVKAKSNAKRKRHLGYITLNDRFEGSHGHHVDKNHVLYIPAKLHRSVYHNVFTGQGMAEINTLAFEWMNKNTGI